jgi:hypothetical protein
MLTTNQDFNENADVIFSIPSGADIDAGILVIGNSNKTIGVGVGADLNIGRSFIV